MRRLLFLLALLISTGIHAEARSPTFEVQTRLGLSKIAPSEEGGSWNQVTLKGKPVYRATGPRDFISIHGHFMTRTADVLLLSLGCACSDGVPDPLVFLVLELNGQIRVVTDDRFFSSDYTILPRTVDGVPHVDLGFEGGRVKTASLRSGSVSIAFRDSAVVPLDDTSCRSLYERMESECAKPVRYERPCDQDVEMWYSNATLSTLRAYAQRPGFRRPAWNGACRSTCQGNAPDYGKFSKDVCSARGP